MFWVRHRHDHFHHYPDLAEVKGEIADLRDLMNERFIEMAKTLDEILAQGQDVLAKVQRNDDLDESFLQLHAADVAVIRDLRAQLAAAGTDPAKLQQLGDLMDQLATRQDAEAQKKLDAMKANTDAA